jgi:hypothetical protein
MHSYLNKKIWARVKGPVDTFGPQLVASFWTAFASVWFTDCDFPRASGNLILMMLKDQAWQALDAFH